MNPRVLSVSSLLVMACADDSGAPAIASDSSTNTSAHTDGTTNVGDTTNIPTTSPDVGEDSESGSGTEGETGQTTGPERPRGRVVIDEVYFTGAAPFADVDHYFSDQFIAIRNISRAPVAMGGLMIADVFGVAGEISPGVQPNAVNDDREHVYLSSVWMIPGAPEDVILAPGARLVIAQDGTNHSPFSTIDLSGADFETFVADSQQDDDSPTVENLDLLHYNAGFDWLIPVFGPSLVLVESSAEMYTHEHAGWTLVAAPVSAVIDGVDILMDAQSAPFKRLPTAVDASFTFASGTYVGEAVRRRRRGGQPIDTDDSGADFEVTTTPAPHF